MKEAHLELTDASGERVWMASGKQLRAEAGRDEGELRDLTCRFLDKGEIMMEATAGLGRVDWSQRTVILSEKVHAESTVGYGEVRAERATWSVSDRVLRAGGGVEYRRANMTATAGQVTAEMGLKVVHMTDGAVIRFGEPAAEGGIQQ
jgi:hypothetical protein